MNKLFPAFLFVFVLTINNCFSQCTTVNYPGNFIVSANTTFGGIHNVTDTFRIDAGVTLTIPAQSTGCGYIEVNARVIQIFGTIDANGAGFSGGTGGGAGGCWADDGGTDCRGITYCWDKDNCHQLRTDGGAGGANGGGTGGGNAGSNGNNAYGNKQECFAINDDSGRTGGAGGAGGGNGGCYAGNGGSSGGGGNGSGSSGCSGDATCSTTGGAGASGGGASAALCINYGTANTYTIEMGSGGGGAGGGGRGFSASSAGGNGGSGGGYVQLISSGDMFVPGTIYVNGTNGGTGGNGGNAGNANGSCCNDGSPGCDEETYTGSGGGGGGAGGGSGGGILLDAQCGSMIVSGIMEAKGANGGLGGNGGAASSQAGAGGTGALGGGGGGGRIKIFTNTCGANNISSVPDISGGFGLINGTAGTYYTGTNSVVLAAGSVGNNQTICAGTNPDTLLNITPASIGSCTGFNYQWQSAPSATGPWTNIPAANSATYIPTVISSTTFYRRIVTAGSCTDSTNILTVNVNPSPTAVISGNTTICSGDITTLTASGGINYSWNSGATISSITDNPTTNTSYTVLVTDASGCSDTATATVNVLASPTATVSGNTTICSGQSATLTANGGGNYSWSTGQTTSSITITATATATYSVIVFAGSCSDTASISVTVNSSPSANISGNTTICLGQTATLTASGGTNYSWNTGGTNAAISVAPSTTTTYSVIASNSNGCTAAATVSVSVLPVPTATVSGNTTICSGQSTLLTAGGGGNYSWNTGTTTSSISVSPTINTTYSVIVSSGGCSDTTSIFVSVSSSPVASVSGNATICAGETATLTATGGGNYSWSNGASTNFISVSPATGATYSVIVSIGNCSDTASIPVVVNSSPVAVASPGSSAICAGENVMLSASGGGNYLWNPGGQTTAAISVSPTVSTIYSVTVSIGNCTDTASASVTVNPLPSANAGADITINYGDVTILSASGGGTYVWNTGETTISISVSPTTTTSYTIVVTDANGCTDVAVVTVYVEYNCGEVFIPNAFSPNGDLQNDILFVRSGCLKTMHFIIYDRWGIVVFETDDITKGWDGNYSGKKQNSGVYVYSLTYELMTGERGAKKGNVSLIR